MRPPNGSTFCARLEEANWNVSGAARALGMERTNLHKRIRALGIKPGEVIAARSRERAFKQFGLLRLQEEMPAPESISSWNDWVVCPAQAAPRCSRVILSVIQAAVRADRATRAATLPLIDVIAVESGIGAQRGQSELHPCSTIFRRSSCGTPASPRSS